MSKKIIFKNVVFYALANSIQKGFSFLTLFLVALFLNTKEYGSLALINILSSFVQMTVISTIQGSAMRFYIDLKGEERESFIGSLLIFILSIAIFVILVSFFLGQTLVGILFPNSNIPFYPLFAISILTVFFNVPQPVVNAVFRIKEQPRYILKMVFFNSSVALFLILLFLVAFRQGIKGFLLGQLVAAVVAFIVYFFMIRNEFRLTFRWSLLKPALIFSAPLIPYIFLDFVRSRMDVYLLEKYMTLDEIGIYYFGLNIGMVMAAIVSSFASAYSPRMFNLLNEKPIEAAKAEFKQIFIYIYILMILAFVFVSLFSEEIIFLFINKYQSSYKIIPMVSFSCFISGVYLFFHNSFYWTKKTYYVLICSVIMTVVTVLSEILLIPPLGIKGAALGLILGQLAGLLSGYFWGQKIFPMNYEFKRVAFITFFSVASVFAISYTLTNMLILWKLIIKIAVIGVLVKSSFSAAGIGLQSIREML